MDNTKLNKDTIKLVKQSIGTLKKVLQMIEEDSYCFEIIQQIQSVNGTNGRVIQKLLKNHLHSCVMKQFQNGEEEKAIKEILKIYNSK